MIICGSICVVRCSLIFVFLKFSVCLWHIVNACVSMLNSNIPLSCFQWTIKSTCSYVLKTRNIAIMKWLHSMKTPIEYGKWWLSVMLSAHRICTYSTWCVCLKYEPVFCWNWKKMYDIMKRRVRRQKNLHWCVWNKQENIVRLNWVCGMLSALNKILCRIHNVIKIKGENENACWKSIPNGWTWMSINTECKNQWKISHKIHTNFISFRQNPYDFTLIRQCSCWIYQLHFELKYRRPECSCELKMFVSQWIYFIRNQWVRSFTRTPQ